MNRRKMKVLSLILAVAVPGMSAWSCSTILGREFRDAAINGASGAVEAAFFALVDAMLPPPDDGN